MLSLSVSAGTQRKVKLVGVWQQVQRDAQNGRQMNLPVWKVLQADGTFCVFLIADKSGQCIITNEGRYEVKNDSSLVERVTGSITDPSLVGIGNELTYKFIGKDEMHVTYRMPSATTDANETWVRVKLEWPKQH